MRVEAHDHEAMAAAQSTSLAQAAAFEPSHINDKGCGEGGHPGFQTIFKMASKRKEKDIEA